MKKIIFSNYDDMENPYYGGGGAFAIHEVAKRLVKKYDVTVITSKYPNSKNLILDGVKYKRVGTSVSPKIDQISYNLALLIHAQINKYNIWFESFTPPFSTFFLPLFVTNPIIGITHFFNAEEKSKEYKVPFYIIQNISIKFYKNCIALTKEIKKKLLRLNPRMKVSIIPNGVYLPKLNKNLKGSYILFLGRIEVNQKGLNLLIKSYKTIEKDINLKLLVAGDGPKGQVALLKRIIHKNNLQKKIKLLGRVKGAKKDKLLREALFLVLPSRFEMQGIVALEAIAYGKPVITYDITGFRWMPKGTSIRVPAFSIEKYAEAMLVLAQDKMLHKNISAAAKEYSEKFSWPKIAKQYETLIEKLI